MKKEDRFTVDSIIKRLFAQPDYTDEKAVKELSEEGFDLKESTVAFKRRALGLTKYTIEKGSKPVKRGGPRASGGAKLVTIDELKNAVENLQNMFSDFMKSEEIRKKNLIAQL